MSREPQDDAIVVRSEALSGEVVIFDDRFLFAVRSREPKWSTDHETPGDDTVDKKPSPGRR